MMPEISLNILDVAQNSVAAGSLLTEIGVFIDSAADSLEVVVSDNGAGMPPEMVEKVGDPFFTTRTTRKVGLGLPFLKMAAELTGGSFSIKSELGKGTRTRAVFGLSHIDRMPMGDIAGTMVSLIGPNPDLDFILRYSVDGKEFVMDSREVRIVLDGVPLHEPEVLSFMGEFINDNIDGLGARF